MEEREPGASRSGGLLYRESAGHPFRQMPIASDRVRIGRRFENDLILSHASVSRFHAEIVQVPTGWVLVDNQSKFGTFLNGERIERAELTPGDEIQIGGGDGPVVIFHPEEATLPEEEERAPDESQKLDLSADTGGGRSSRDERPADAPDDARRVVERLRAASRLRDDPEALSFVVDAALELTGFERAVLFLLGSGQENMRPEVVRSRAGVPGLDVAADELAFVQYALRSGRVVSVGPNDASGDLSARARSAGISRAIVLPLLGPAIANQFETSLGNDAVIGALYLRGGASTPALSDGSRQVLESLAAEAATVAGALLERQARIAGVRVRHEARAAELLRAVVEGPASDDERARLVCERVRHLLMIGQEERAAAALEEFEEVRARTKLAESSRVEILWRLGETLGRLGDWHRAAGILNTGLEAAREHHPELVMPIRASLAVGYAAIGEVGLARDHGLAAVSALGATGTSSPSYAEALLAVGMLERLEGASPSAAHALRTAARIAEESEDLATTARALVELGRVALERGELHEATVALEQVLEIAAQISSPSLDLDGREALATCLVRAGAWRRAESVVDGAALAKSRDRADARLGRLLLLGATLHARRGETDSAIEALSRVRAIAHRIQVPGLAVEASLVEADLLLSRGERDRAKAVLLGIEDLAAGLGDARLEAGVGLAWTDLELKSGDVSAAEARMARAQAAARRCDDLAISGSLQRMLGRLEVARKRFAEAQHRFAQALSVFRTVGDRYETALTYLDLGRLLVDAGDPACARTHLERARDIFSGLDANEPRSKAEAVLAEAVAASRGSAPLSYSSVLLGAASESQFVGRLVRAARSRELLLRELSSIAVDVAQTDSAAVVVRSAGREFEVAAASGDEDGLTLPKDLLEVAVLGETARGACETVYPVAVEEPVLLLVGRPVAAGSRVDRSLESVVALVRQGFEVVALRAATRRAELPDRFGSLGLEADPLVASGLLYASASMRELAERLQRIRTSSATVLITGESGVGKELVARAVHAASGRRKGPFVPFNCTAVPRDLVESQLFGHKRGAFTGASADSPGIARAARNGTLFLDEVGDLPLEVQPKLLRFLELGEIQPVGAAAPDRVDVRVVGATNADLERAVRENRFREDLFHRLNVIRLHVPPLRERREDIPLLVSHFLVQTSRRAGHAHPPSITEEALGCLVACSWPGNVRQLRNEIERLVAFSLEGATIGSEALSEGLRSKIPPDSSRPAATSCDAGDLPLAERLRLFECEQIQRVLAETGDNLTQAALRLGMARQNLQRRLKKLGLR